MIAGEWRSRHGGHDRQYHRAPTRRCRLSRPQRASRLQVQRLYVRPGGLPSLLPSKVMTRRSKMKSLALTFLPISLAPEPARPGFVCYRDAPGSDSKLLRRYCVPKPSALLPQLSRICLPTVSSLRTYLMRGPGQRCIPIVHSPGWKARKCPPSGSILIFLAGIVARKKKDEPMCGCLSGGTGPLRFRRPCGSRPEVLLSCAVDHFVAGPVACRARLA